MGKHRKNDRRRPVKGRAVNGDIACHHPEERPYRMQRCKVVHVSEAATDTVADWWESVGTML